MSDDQNRPKAGEKAGYVEVDLTGPYGVVAHDIGAFAHSDTLRDQIVLRIFHKEAPSVLLLPMTAVEAEKIGLALISFALNAQVESAGGAGGGDGRGEREIHRYAPKVIERQDGFAVRFEQADEGGFIRFQHHELSMRRLNAALAAAAVRLAEFKEALAFYAAPETWKFTICKGHPQIDGHESPAERDGGSQARAVMGRGRPA